MGADFQNGITIVGSGNMAWHLSHKCKNKGVPINMVISKTGKNASELAKTLNVPYSIDLNDVPKESDLVLLCVSDNAVEVVAKELELEVPKAHTAGSVPMLALGAPGSNSGVFYPFQTLSKLTDPGGIDFPVCVEIGNQYMRNVLMSLANTLSNTVVELDSAQRKKLHLSGIVANNFTNFLFTQAYTFLEKNNIPSELLQLIVDQTAKQVKLGHPKEVQTGPARRGSKTIIDDHIKMLEKMPDLQEIYAFLSEKIMNYYNK